MGGVFLNNLPGSAPIPANYILQVQVRATSASHGTFGIFFRMQSGEQHHGGFSFLIEPSGYWNGYSYDDATGQASLIYGRQGKALDTQRFTTIDILVQGETFTIYYNGVNQGMLISPNYPAGNLGLAVDQGTEASFKNVALYAVA